MNFARGIIIGGLLCLVFLPLGVGAQGGSPTPEVGVELDLEGMEATEAAEATMSAQEATRSGIVRVVERRSDITEPEGEVKGRLEAYLDERDPGPLGVTNFLQHAVRNAVAQGVPANTIVLVLLFPVLSAIIAGARHLIGLRGFGIFVPAVLSVAFVATGLATGILLFLVILGVASLGRKMIGKLKLQYLPRLALLLWFVALGILAALFAAPVLRLEQLMTVNIFPILILILLAEDFIEVQMGKSRREAIELTAETIILAVICSLVLSLDLVQRLAILHPEMTVFGVALFNVFMGRYVGLRLVEYLKFRGMVKG